MALFHDFNSCVTDGRTNRRTDGRTDGRTDRRTDTPSYRDARTHLKRNLSQSFTEQCSWSVVVDLYRLTIISSFIVALSLRPFHSQTNFFFFRLFCSVFRCSVLNHLRTVISERSRYYRIMIFPPLISH